jgi:hypothetical protein
VCTIEHACVVSICCGTQQHSSRNGGGVQSYRCGAVASTEGPGAYKNGHILEIKSIREYWRPNGNRADCRCWAGHQPTSQQTYRTFVGASERSYILDSRLSTDPAKDVVSEIVTPSNSALEDAYYMDHNKGWRSLINPDFVKHGQQNALPLAIAERN